MVPEKKRQFVIVYYPPNDLYKSPAPSVWVKCPAEFISDVLKVCAATALPVRDSLTPIGSFCFGWEDEGVGKIPCDSWQGRVLWLGEKRRPLLHFIEEHIRPFFAEATTS